MRDALGDRWQADGKRGEIDPRRDVLSEVVDDVAGVGILDRSPRCADLDEAV